MQIIEKNISDLVPYENNPRRNEDAVQYVKASIQEFGFKVPVIIDKDNVIIAGHTRLLAAKELEMYGKVFPCDTNDMVVVKDIEAFSYCEHHLALIYNMRISVAYLPEGHVIGLSKIARIVDMCCKRLQLQERIGHDIVDVMTRIVGPNVAVRIEANHSCMTARGIKKPSSKTVTYATSGAFEQDTEFNRFQAALQ